MFIKSLFLLILIIPSAYGFNPQSIKKEFKDCLNFTNGDNAENIKNCLVITFNSIPNNITLQYCSGSSRSSLISEINKSIFSSSEINLGFESFCKHRKSSTNRD